jgi:hypothetical protein
MNSWGRPQVACINGGGGIQQNVQTSGGGNGDGEGKDYGEEGLKKQSGITDEKEDN